MIESVERRALYPGSFDPPTKGHTWVMEKVSSNYDFGTVAIGVNPGKTGRFAIAEREEMLQEIIETKGLTNLDTYIFEGLLAVDVADMIDAKVIVRGTRNGADYSYENEILQVNRAINPNVETVFISPPPELLQVSSSMAMGLMGYEGWIPEVEKMVPPNVLQRLVELQGKKDFKDLNDKWFHLYERLGAKGNARQIFQDIFKRYSEPHRYYHTVDHLKSCLLELNHVSHLVDNPDTLELALWFHDAIYQSNIPNSHVTDDEGASADLAADTIVNSMGLSQDVANEVSGLITAIKRRDKPLSKDEQYMIDIDTTIFGRSERLYSMYENAIRKEFSWVPLEFFKTKRAEILASFLPVSGEEKTVYYTEYFERRYGKKAESNLRKAITKLLTA